MWFSHKQSHATWPRDWNWPEALVREWRGCGLGAPCTTGIPCTMGTPPMTGTHEPWAPHAQWVPMNNGHPMHPVAAQCTLASPCSTAMPNTTGISRTASAPPPVGTPHPTGAPCSASASVHHRTPHPTGAPPLAGTRSLWAQCGCPVGAPWAAAPHAPPVPAPAPRRPRRSPAAALPWKQARCLCHLGKGNRGTSAGMVGTGRRGDGTVGRCVPLTPGATLAVTVATAPASCCLAATGVTGSAVCFSADKSRPVKPVH